MPEPHSPRVLDSLALAYFLSGEPGKAAGVELRALKLLGDEDSTLRPHLERKLAQYTEAAEEAGVEIEEVDLP